MKINFPIQIWLIWLGIILGVLYFGSAFNGHQINLNTILVKWDGAWYNNIVNYGYSLSPGQQSNVAFFPFYPLLTWLGSKIFGGGNAYIIAGLISSLSFLGALAFIYDLTRQKTDEATARVTIALIAFSPFSYYFMLYYTEGLFLLLSAACFWYVNRRRWLTASILA